MMTCERCEAETNFLLVIHNLDRSEQLEVCEECAKEFFLAIKEDLEVKNLLQEAREGMAIRLSQNGSPNVHR